jgi:hypothetical protein
MQYEDFNVLIRQATEEASNPELQVNSPRWRMGETDADIVQLQAYFGV